MDIIELRQKICQLQAKIQVLCEEFQNDTRVNIVDVKLIGSSYIAGQPNTHLIIKVDVKL